MKKVMYSLIFWLSIISILLAFWTFTIGQAIPYEFRNNQVKSSFYDCILSCTPVAILLTLFGTIKKKHNRDRKILTVILTLAVLALSFYYWVTNLLFTGVGEWSTDNIAYENRQCPKQQIKEQSMDAGVFGTCHRVVHVQPFTGFFYKVIRVDTTSIDKKKWKRVDKKDVTH